MTKATKKPATSAPGVKMLITAASLAATVGGWAVIGANEPKPVVPPAPPVSPAPAQVAAPVAAVPAITIKLAPLPTLVPPLTPQPRSQVVTINQSRAAAPQAAAPQAAAPTELVLRDVSAPVSSGAPQVRGGGSTAAPAPVANTGSSR